MHTAALEHRKLSTAIAQRVGRGTSNKDLRWALYESESKIWAVLGRFGPFRDHELLVLVIIIYCKLLK